MQKSSSNAPEPAGKTPVVRLPGLPGAVYTWIDQRLGLEELLALARKKTVPQHRHSFWYLWGGLCLFFFAVQVVTGVLLLLYYRPGPEAYDSVRRITYDMDFGWLIRSLHEWGANLMICCLFVHMFSVFFMKAYRGPREFGWWSGLGLLGLTMVFGFSGYLLPMDELAFFATKVGLEVPSALPGVGAVLTTLVRAGPEVNEFTIQRFFALHVVILPGLFLPLLGLHLWLIQRHGNAVPPSEARRPLEARRSIPFFPDFFQKDLGMWLIALNLVAILAVVFPAALGPQADVLKPAPLGIHPEWYFMSQFQVLKVLGQWLPGTTGEILGILLFSLGGLLWGIIPLYDRSPALARQARRATWFGLFAVAGLIIMTIWGYLAV